MRHSHTDLPVDQHLMTSHLNKLSVTHAAHWGSHLSQMYDGPSSTRYPRENERFLKSSSLVVIAMIVKRCFLRRVFITSLSTFRLDEEYLSRVATRVHTHFFRCNIREKICLLNTLLTLCSETPCHHVRLLCFPGWNLARMWSSRLSIMSSCEVGFLQLKKGGQELL